MKGAKAMSARGLFAAIASKTGQKPKDVKAVITALQGIETSAPRKFAIPQLVMALSNEWSSKGVQVNCIAPGYIATEMTEPLRADAIRGPQSLERIPTGRWGNPEDLKGMVVFLASSASDYVTGAMLPVDGGWLGR